MTADYSQGPLVSGAARKLEHVAKEAATPVPLITQLHNRVFS